MTKTTLILSCEHAVKTIPQHYQALFKDHEGLLNTHRGIDFGASDIALHLQKSHNCELVYATVSRLLIDCNRSLDNPSCFSNITKTLSHEDKQAIINHFYLPYRHRLTDLIKKHIKEGDRVLHLSIHSFTPELNGKIRKTDIGLLYDPKRESETKFAKLWQKTIKKQSPQYRAWLNYPYRGTSDGLTVSLRKFLPDSQYMGIEVESNQALTLNDKSLEALKEVFSKSLAAIFP